MKGSIDDVSSEGSSTGGRLFWASFLTLIAAGIGFSVRGAILVDWSAQFGFTQGELGGITGGGLVGFGLTIIFFSFFADLVGYGRLMTIAFLLHVASVVVTLAAAPIYASLGKDATYQCLYWGALLFSLAYAPSLSWLRKRMGGCRPALLFPLASAVVLNIPVFLIEILAIGRTLAPSEAFFSISAFLLMGTVFGLGFVWNYQDTAL